MDANQEKIREDENNHLSQMAASKGFTIFQKMAKDLEEINLKRAYSTDTIISVEDRFLKLGEISGMRKLLQLVVSRSENETKTPSWTETKGVPAWQTKEV